MEEHVNECSLHIDPGRGTLLNEIVQVFVIRELTKTEFVDDSFTQCSIQVFTVHIQILIIIYIVITIFSTIIHHRWYTPAFSNQYLP